MTQLVVNEIFHSIQGESSHAGRPCVFVRLTYCNLRCSYCDTEYAFHEGTPMEIEAILKSVGSFGCPLVEVTGGEPLVQEGSLDLMKHLCDKGYETLLETGGAIDIQGVDPRVRRIVDFKCPGSGMSSRNLWSNALALRDTDEAKFVIGSREDFDWAVRKIRDYGIDERCPVLMSPVHDQLAPETLAEWVLGQQLNVRLQVQLHKYIWSPEMRGV